MKKLLLAAGIAVLAYVLIVDNSGRRLLTHGSMSSSDASDQVFADAFSGHRSNVIAEGRGTVTRLLADDEKGDRHQRFIVTLSSGQTLLVAHNIDLAPRVQSLSVGDTVEFKGEYEWSDLGGTMHWTHRDPAGRHPGGWILHNGHRYE